jgi:hypothetical protein
MEQHIKEMSLQVASACSRAQGGRIQLGFDYIIAADVLAAPLHGNGEQQQQQQQSTLPLPPPLTAAAAAAAAGSSSDHGASPMDEVEPAALASSAAAAAPDSMNGAQTAAC